jgi:homopolymeric O-antigen transport system permease protein
LAFAICELRSGIGGFGRVSLLSPIRRILAQRALIRALVRRELSARYRGGALGFLWSFVNPLLLLLVYATVFRFVFAPRADVRPYALFLFGGVLVWSFVSSALLDAVEAFRVHGPLLRKTTVAPEVFPAAAVGARLAHLLLALPVLAAAIALVAARGDIHPGPAVLLFPLVLVLLVAAVLGAALFCSALAVPFGDLRDIVANLLTLSFFVTPVLYPVEAVPERWRWILWLNPWAAFFSGVQDTLFFFRPIAPADWARMAVWTALSLAVGGAVFERLRDSIAEEA